MPFQPFAAIVLGVAMLQAAALQRPTLAYGAECPCCAGREWRDAGWQFLETENFKLCARATADEVRQLAHSCEELRKHLDTKWLGTTVEQQAERERWTPRCLVYVHPTAASYLREVGPGQQTAGSSLVEFDKGQLITRRIDLRADHPEGYQDALAHEMTHVVVADRFIQSPLPRWADEGMAVLADSREKQKAHNADLHDSRRNGTAFRLAELFALEEYPQPHRQAAFYGQSASLARYLVERHSADKFVAFIEVACRSGYDTAAREVYGLASLVELEQGWIAHLKTPQAAMVSEDTAPLKNMPIIGRQLSMNQPRRGR
ncbi:MAG: hypothetical protein JSS27_12150 [Planctomycetes bacterium]|nr:hypothetical protein [Planctomycetota bacterium]